MFRWMEGIIIKLIRPIIVKEQKKILITTDKAREEAEKSIQALEKEVIKRIEQRTELFLNQAIEKIVSEGDRKTEEMSKAASQLIEEEFSRFIQEFRKTSGEIVNKLNRIRGDKVKIIIDGENFRRDLERLGFGEAAPEALEGLKKLIKEGEIESSILYDSRFPGRKETVKEDIWRTLRRRGVEVVTRPLKIGLQQGGKSFVDPMVIKEIMMTLLESQYGRIVLFAGDSHYYPAIEEVQKWGVEVTVISSREQLSQELKEIADSTFYLENLIF